MANELQIVAQGDALTVYAVIRRVSDVFVWNGTTFVTWVDGDIGDYDIPLTNASGDLYIGDFPTGVTVGTKVRINYYEQDGGSPAITDLLLKSIEVVWNGVSLAASGGSVAAAACVLLGLDEAKRHMNITDTAKDDQVQQIINQQSDRVNKLLGRSLCADDYVEFQPVRGDGVLLLEQSPVITVNRVSFNRDTALRIRFTGGGVRAMASVTQTGVRLTSTNTGGTTTTTELQFSIYPTMAMMATAIDGVSGWEAEAVQTALLSSNLYRGVSRDSLDVYANLEAPSDDVVEYTIDYQAGIVRILDARICDREVMAEYRAGYETIPDAIKGVMVELVSAAMARTGDRSAGPTAGDITSESIGDYSYSKGQTSATNTTGEQTWLTGSQQAALAPFMQTRVGVSL